MLNQNLHRGGGIPRKWCSIGVACYGPFPLPRETGPWWWAPSCPSASWAPWTNHSAECWHQSDRSTRTNESTWRWKYIIRACYANNTASVLILLPFLIVGHLLEPFLNGRIIRQDVRRFKTLFKHLRRDVLLENVVAGQARHFGKVSAASGDHFRQLKLNIAINYSE